MTHAQRPVGHAGGRVDPLHPGWHPQHDQAPVNPQPPDGYRPPIGYGPGAGYGPPPAPGYATPSHYGSASAYPRTAEPAPTPPPPPPPSGGPFAPAGQPGNEVAGRDERWWADLRQQVVYRCTRLNAGHLHAADERYGTREALGPHAVMLFFTSDAPAEPQGFRLHTAVRLFLSAPESHHLPALLTDLAGIARTNIAHGAAAGQPWHPLGPQRSMVNGGDMTLPPDATYAGAGVSTLDSADGSWYQLAHALRSPSGTAYSRSVFDLKGQCYVLLTDDTAIKVDRDPHARRTGDGVRSSKPLDASWNSLWHNPHATLTEQGDSAIREVWRRLAALHDILRVHLGGEPAA
ncbi:hypothetical protein [Micromonospora sp. C51]|uniref:hypothetical protein n=1 Tax=Micromonospora sp. C51 TaxID=2824879 RepID=UPI001FFC9773|nr:hypothetical protein [Micromonospora sp. C51]